MSGAVYQDPRILVTSAIGESCDLDAPDHRGEVYRFEFRCQFGVLEFVLCRHHARNLKHRLEEI